MSFGDANNFNIINLNSKLKFLYLVQKFIGVGVKSNNVRIVIITITNSVMSNNITIVALFTYWKSDWRESCDAVLLRE